ncbi:LuxR C-terminal-related transcriptional regulator [Agromyces subbeticus]|uniref:LuxR C-terminal-related transcriptional regulator n=1 Tax=Agromyces subbeticus TaxID=293890 RepID=UPI0003B4812B|nr:LuxR C-terminal-related transcriptional regulator [Agromyces subbeticus]
MVERLTSEYLIERPALKRRLAAALSLPVTLVVAQAGAGKTVLLQQWAADHPSLPFTWIDIEPADDDPVRFTSRLLEALAQVRPAVRQLARLSALHTGGLGEALLSALRVELESFPPIVIVLDDLHHLGNTALLKDLGRFVAALPPNVHLVISTRIDPPIAWSRLRLRGRLLELRQSDLAMTDAESASLLSRVARRDLGTETIDVLVRRTEGWAAGLQLAALTLRFHADTAESAEFVAEFDGSDRLVADYLTEEVLDAVPAAERELLLRMSPLDILTADLVDHVLERDDAQRLFEQLELESMFVVGLDSRRERYRFHHLFRDLLRYRLRAEDAAEEVRLLERAADFHLAVGELVPAVEYLLRARDWDRALATIMTRGSDIFERGEMRTVIRWITSVPEHVRATRRDVTIELGILVGMQGEAARAVELLSRVAGDPQASLGERAVALTWISATTQWSSHPETCLRAAEEAIELLELIVRRDDVSLPDIMGLSTPELMMTLALGSGGRALFLSGDLDAAGIWMERAFASDGIAYPPFRVGMLGSLALLRIWSGRTTEAEQLAAEAVHTASEVGLLTHPIIADAYLAQSLVALERGRPEAAAAPLRDGGIRAEANHRTQLGWITRHQRALLASAEGRHDEALGMVDLVRLGAAPAPAPVIRERLRSTQMSLLRRAGRSADARHLGEIEESTGAASTFEAIAAELALGQPDAASRRFAADDAVFTAAGPRGTILRAMAAAWIAESLGEHATALEEMQVALDLAAPEGLVALFVDAGPQPLELVAELAAARGGIAQAVLLRRDELRAPTANDQLIDPLTERELQILDRLPGHSTSAELAQLCFVSVNTLKTHMAHIYRKLGVNGRSAAIARAQELGLLGSQAGRLSPADAARA